MTNLSPELRKLITDATGKPNSTNEPIKGIIPFEPLEWDERDELVYRIAETISDAVQGPAIHVSELAEMIVDMMQERP